MTLRYVFSELRTGLRRNLTMHLAVILTLFVSLTLAGCGILLQREAKVTTNALGSDLQILVNLCTDKDPSLREGNPNCSGGAVTAAQMKQVESVLKQSPDVSAVRYQSQEQGYQIARKLYPADYFSGPTPIIRVQDWPSAFWVTLKDPNKTAGVISAVRGLPGVSHIKDQHEQLGQVYSIIGSLKVGSWIAAVFLLIAALLEVANTIRLAALARRKEIEIMRLVGASTLYIALPFLLEALVTAIIGVALASGVLALVERYGIQNGLADKIHFLPWIGWGDWLHAIIGGWPVGILILGPALTVIPTLLLTRKYIRV
ncbi:MAG: permease-like cell division protein FtsX [Nocardioidaceae bacterium]|nr:permease-like cell division protein FtsX [Nocardioidaceae bacterium]MCL2614721.1 permease-like cell division protein FtsX [Nocardioidaceae bacterium]